MVVETYEEIRDRIVARIAELESLGVADGEVEDLRYWLLSLELLHSELASLRRDYQ